LPCILSADAEAAEKFIKDIVERVFAREASAAIIVNTELVQRRLHAGKVAESKALLQETKTSLDSLGGIVDSLVHGAYYKGALEYHRVCESARNLLLTLAAIALLSCRCEIGAQSCASSRHFLYYLLWHDRSRAPQANSLAILCSI